ncbi:MAG TPA: TRAP transporter large permease subunit, partial [Burkholderiales bacterium]|nr:TRAP transporter large permease subunit [Burkholderiales bacterium]
MRMRKELWFGFGLMAAVVIGVLSLMPWGELQSGHLGLLMLALIVVAIMLGFPTAFTLMGMGVFFGWLAYRAVNPDLAVVQILDLMVQRAYAVMSNDVLIAVPLFVFMGYLVERAALIDRLFRSLHLATYRVPGSLAVATIITCAVFATATGIVGAVVTLMGLLAYPAMLRAGYHVQIGAGAITAGGCLGILIPPSVLLIVYGATAGVSVVQLYAGALFPGLMLAGLYLSYVILLAKLKPNLMPRLPEEEARIELPPFARALAPRRRNALAGLFTATLAGSPVSRKTAVGQLVVALLPALVVAGLLVHAYRMASAPPEAAYAGTFEVGGLVGVPQEQEPAGLIGAPEADDEAAAEAEAPLAAEAPGEAPGEEAATDAAATEAAEREPLPLWFWIVSAIFVALLAVLYSLW